MHTIFKTKEKERKITNTLETVGINFSASAIFLLLFFFSFSSVSAFEQSDWDFTYRNTNLTDTTVNNSQYFDGYSVATLWTYFSGLGNNLWCQLSGCTMEGDIDMNGNNIENVDSIYFNTSTTCNPEQGEICYDSNDDNWQLGIQGGSVLNAGEEMYVPKAKNSQGTTIYNGQVVYISGASGENFEMKLANANNHTTAMRTVAVATQDILDGQKGKFTTYGLVRNVDMSAFNDGDVVYLNTSDGGLTNVAPADGMTKVRVGYVGNAVVDGTLFVQIDPRPYLEGLSNVESNTAEQDDMIIFNSTTGTWQHKNVGEVVPSYWNRTSTTITPATADDILDVTSTLVDNTITGSVVAGWTPDYEYASPYSAEGYDWYMKVYGYKNGSYTPTPLTSNTFNDGETYDPMLFTWNITSSDTFDSYKILLYRNDVVVTAWTTTNKVGTWYLDYEYYALDVTDGEFSSTIVSPLYAYTNNYSLLTDGIKTKRIGARDNDSFIYLDNDFDKLLTQGGIYSKSLYDGFTIPSGAGTRFMWIPSKGAFRAGTVNSDRWDEANIGSNSFAFGYDGKAYGYSAGHFGYRGVANGTYSTHFGFLGVASATSSTHFGVLGLASGDYATHFGYSGEATGGYSIHFGDNGVSSGSFSAHFGGNGLASGDYATHYGFNNIVNSYAQTAFGRLSASVGSPNAKSWVSTDPLVVFGNGAGTLARSNSRVIYKNGNDQAMDNVKALFGTGSDASIYYDGTNMIINPKEVGSGDLKVLGRLNATSITTGAVNATIMNSTSLNTGNINATNTRVVGNFNQTSGNSTINMIYGFMYIHNESNANTVISSANTYYNISENVKNGTSNGFVFNNSNSLVVQHKGVYSIDYHIGFSQATGAGDEWHFAVGVNGMEKDECHTPRKINTITDFGSAGTSCALSLNVGDIITAMIENENDDDDAKIMDMQLKLVRVGN